LFAGKFIPKKRPMDLVNAVAMLQGTRSSKSIHLLFTGSGELGAEVRGGCDVVYDAEADAIPRSPAISSNGNPAASFTGFLNQTEISRAYVAADCLVLPSDYRETWGLVVNEAMASGLPCIVSDACGCAEDLVEPERRYRMGHCSELTQAINSVMNSGNGHTQSLHSLTKFDFSASVASIVNLYRSGLRTI
jgi:glycosyltransferase involved in cell wall biosynthesis